MEAQLVSKDTRVRKCGLFLSQITSCVLLDMRPTSLRTGVSGETESTLLFVPHDEAKGGLPSVYAAEVKDDPVDPNWQSLVPETDAWSEMKRLMNSVYTTLPL